MTTKVLHIILAGLLLLSTIGVTMNFHLCGGKIESWALFVKAKSCHDINNDSCLTHRCGGAEHHDDEKDGCCHDKSEVLKLSLPQLRENIVSFEVTELINLPLAVFREKPAVFTNISTTNIHYKPPLLTFNQPAFTQVFLF